MGTNQSISQSISQSVSRLASVLQKQQLLKMDVPAKFMQVALDEGPGPPIKYQYAELGKLYSVVSLLVRCCDVSSRCQSSVAVSKLETRLQCQSVIISASLHNSVFLIGLWKDVSISLLQLDIIYEGQ